MKMARNEPLSRQPLWMIIESGESTTQPYLSFLIAAALMRKGNWPVGDVSVIFRHREHHCEVPAELPRLSCAAYTPYTEASAQTRFSPVCSLSTSSPPYSDCLFPQRVSWRFQHLGSTAAEFLHWPSLPPARSVGESYFKDLQGDFPGGPVVKNARGMSWIPGWGAKSICHN